MKIINLNKENKEIWDGFVKDNLSGTFFHLSDWSFMCEEVFGYKNLSFMIALDSRTLAIMPLSFKKILGFRIFESAGYGGYGDIIFANDIGDSEKNQAEEIIKSYLINLSGHYHVIAINILSRLYNRKTEDIYQNIHREVIRTKGLFSIIDISQPEEYIWDSLKSSVRQAIRKAQRNELIIFKAVAYSDMDEFYSFIVKRYSKTGANIMPKKYFDFLWEKWGQDNGILNLFFIQKGNKKIGGILITKFRDTATFLNMSSDSNMFYLRPNNLLIWEAIRWAKKSGCRYYEVNRLYVRNRWGKKGRLAYFFKGYGGEVAEYLRITVVFSKLKFKLYTLVSRIIYFLLPNR